MKKMLLLLFVVLVGSRCSGFIQLNTNLPLNTTKLTVVNNTTSVLTLYVDGSPKDQIRPTEVNTRGYWVGGGAYQSSVQVSVTLVDDVHNRSYSEVVTFSSYYKYSYVFTAREENGRLYVERR